MDDIGKCPVMHGSATSNSGVSTSNRDWWPNQLNLNILRQHSNLSNPMDKDLACDIHVVNLRTMLKSAMTLKPSDNSALILHRQGFNGCYKPVGMTCSTNGGKVSFIKYCQSSFYDITVKVVFMTVLSK